ncbi:MAG: hypothetical protein JOZ96_23870 [Acidobacteria bacterium]|nr:hypothetical protein [Acidobacteriota bacterium]
MKRIVLLTSLLLLALASLPEGRRHLSPTTAGATTLFQPVIADLRNFGAVGDGVANDGPALQQALDAIANGGGGTLIVPAGRYAITTPVSKSFANNAVGLTVRGAASATPIITNGTGEQQTRGLNLTSEFIIKTGAANAGIALGDISDLLITDVSFAGTDGVATDSVVPLYLGRINNATIRHCEFYGLSTFTPGGGAIIFADTTGLTIDQTAFLGSEASSGTYSPVVLAYNWKSVTVTESVFSDYGQRPGFLGKSGFGAAWSWVLVGGAAPTSGTERRDVTIRNVFMDEGVLTAVGSLPDRYNQSSPTPNLMYLSDMRVNVNNLGTSGMYLDRPAQRLLVERVNFDWTHNTNVALNILNAGEVVLDNLKCTATAKRILADNRVGKLTQINSGTCNSPSRRRRARAC